MYLVGWSSSPTGAGFSLVLSRCISRAQGECLAYGRCRKYSMSGYMNTAVCWGLLVVQQSRLHTSTAGGMGLFPSSGNSDPIYHMTCPSPPTHYKKSMTKKPLTVYIRPWDGKGKGVSASKRVSMSQMRENCPGQEHTPVWMSGACFCLVIACSQLIAEFPEMSTHHSTPF